MLNISATMGQFTNVTYNFVILGIRKPTKLNNSATVGSSQMLPIILGIWKPTMLNISAIIVSSQILPMILGTWRLTMLNISATVEKLTHVTCTAILGTWKPAILNQN